MIQCDVPFFQRELQNGLLRLNISLTPKQFEFMFAEADKNKDGKLSYLGKANIMRFLWLRVTRYRVVEPSKTM